jgi:hypothetical protein
MAIILKILARPCSAILVLKINISYEAQDVHQHKVSKKP